MSTTNIHRSAVENYLKTNFTPVILISGYYGFDNLGDDLILHVLVEQLKQRNTRIIVLSKKPEETAERFGVEAIHRTNILKILDAMAQCHLFISGGGGLLQDKTGPNSVLYYGGLLLLAELFDIPTICFAQGVGPIAQATSRWFAGKVLSKTTSICVRDDRSANTVQSLTGKRPEITLDPVWLMEMPDKRVEEKAGGKTETLVTGVSLRSWLELTPVAIEKLAGFFKQWQNELDQAIEFRLFSLQEVQDNDVLNQFAEQLHYVGLDQYTMIPSHQVLDEIQQCDVFFGMRYHSLLLAILSGVKVYGLAYDDKVEQLLKRLNLKGSRIENFALMSVEEVQGYFKKYPDIELESLRDESYKSFEMIDQLLDSKVRDYLIEET